MANTFKNEIKNAFQPKFGGSGAAFIFKNGINLRKN